MSWEIHKFVKFDVVLRIWGEGIVLEEITQEIGVEPTRVRRKGEVRTLTSKDQVIEKTTSWQISTRERLQSGSITSHIEYLVQSISERKVYTPSLAGVEGAHIYVGVFRDTAPNHNAVEFIIDNSLLGQIAMLGLSVNFIYH